MKNMKLSTKLIGGFVIVAVIAALIGGVGFWSLNVAKTAQDDSRNGVSAGHPRPGNQ